MQSRRVVAGSFVRILARIGWAGPVAAAAVSFFASTAGAQTPAPYVVTVAPETYQPLPIAGGSATALSISGDEGFGTVQLPFPVQFFGQTYNDVRISTNVFAAFNNDGNTWTNTTLPNASTPNGLVAPWWDDNTCDSGNIKTQVVGTTPTRQFVIEWHCRYLGGSGQFQTQLWLSEGSTTLRVKYGAPGVSSSNASIGIENQNGTIGYSPIPCGAAGNCSMSANWPQNQVVTYAQGPDLTVPSVTGSPIAYSGVLSHVEAVGRNVGGEEALGFTMRFWVSADRTLGAGDVEIGTSTTTADVQPGQSANFTLDAPIPTGLNPGPYYLLAEVDPLNVVREDSETNNVGVYGPFDIGLPAPDLVVESIAVPPEAEPGVSFPLDWTVRNIGNLIGSDVPYALMLSNNDVVTASDRRIFTGTFSVEALTSLPIREDVTLPSDVSSGNYWLGIVIDPDNEVFELDDLNNEGASGDSFVVSTRGLQILTTTLPPAEVGSTYCVQLRAAGGDGAFTWNVQSGALPEGILLSEERAGLPDDGPPLATMLCGKATVVGTYDFSVRVTSAGLSAVQSYQLIVNESGMPLRVATPTLPQADFQAAYEAQLMAVGGRSPYEWTLASGELPPGIVLERDGSLHGRPIIDGAFPVSVRVLDAAGNTTTADLLLQVASPMSLTCVTRALPTSNVGDAVSFQLLAAGGTRPYKWRSGESRRLASGVTDDGRSYGSAAPPGFRLAEDGIVTGSAREAGEYVWTVEVSDGANAIDTCLLGFSVGYTQGLSVATSALPSGIVDTPYRAQLQVAGATGTPSWSLADGSFLPDGLELSPSGEISGTVPSFVLEGAKSRVYAFLVRVTDESNRPAVAALSIDVLAEERKPVDPGATVPKKDEGGCSAGAGVPGLLGIGLALAMLRRRR